MKARNTLALGEQHVLRRSYGYEVPRIDKWILPRLAIGWDLVSIGIISELCTNQKLL
jgi:hypothetical protein